MRNIHNRTEHSLLSLSEATVAAPATLSPYVTAVFRVTAVFPSSADKTAN